MLPKKRRVISDDDFSSFAASIGDDDDALSAQRRAPAPSPAPAPRQRTVPKKKKKDALKVTRVGAATIPRRWPAPAPRPVPPRGPKKRFKSTNLPRPSALDLMRATILGPPRAAPPMLQPVQRAAEPPPGWRQAKAAAVAVAVAAAPAPATPPKRKTPPAREEATAADAAALPAFAVGARVEAKWGWQWSRAVIDRVNDDGTYDVEWVDEPDVFNTVAAADVRAAVGDAPAPPPQAASAPEEETPPAAAAVGNEGEEHAESVRWLLDGAAPKVVAEMLLVNACFEIAFAQANPNRPESASYTRYEAYKKAKCGADVIALGGSKSDVLHNYKKGFLRVVKCPAMIGYDLDRDAVSSEREEEGEEDAPPEPTMLARRTARRAQKRELFVAESATVDNKRAKRAACE